MIHLYCGHQEFSIFCSYFGRNDDFINSFWNCRTFSWKSLTFHAVYRLTSITTWPLCGWKVAVLHFSSTIINHFLWLKKILYAVSKLGFLDSRFLKTNWFLLDFTSYFYWGNFNAKANNSQYIYNFSVSNKWTVFLHVL